MHSDDAPGLIVTATSAVGARAALGAHGRWNGELAVLDAALDALDVLTSGDAPALVIRLSGAEVLGLVGVRMIALGPEHVVVATRTSDGIEVARYSERR